MRAVVETGYLNVEWRPFGDQVADIIAIVESYERTRGIDGIAVILRGENMVDGAIRPNFGPPVARHHLFKDGRGVKIKAASGKCAPYLPVGKIGSEDMFHDVLGDDDIEAFIR